MDYEDDYRPSFTKNEIDPIVKNAGVLVTLFTTAMILIWAILMMSRSERPEASQTRSNIKHDLRVVQPKEAL